MLFHYGSDGTPLLSQHRWTVSTGAQKVHRSGGSLEEFLVERAFILAYDSQWSPMMGYIGRDPRPLSNGKTSWHCFDACVHFFPMVEKIRTDFGITIADYCFDRLFMSAMKTKLEQRHSLLQGAIASGSVVVQGRSTATYLPQFSWILVRGCALHDAHNALKWCLKAVLGDVAERIRKLHIVVESLRNGYSALQLHLPMFLATHLAFDDGEPFDSQSLYHLWVNLGADSEIAEMVGELNLRWDWSKGKLLLGLHLQGDADVIEKVSFILVSVMRFRRFTESRWLTVGESCRALVCSLALGLHQLVDDTRADQSTSDFYLHGFAECTADVKLYMSVAALVSRVPDTLLNELLEDDRLAPRSAEVEQMVIDEVTWLTVLPDQLWKTLSSLSNAEALDVRNMTIHAAYVALAILRQMVFQPLSGYPWKLCNGDVDQNLDHLAAEEEDLSAQCAVTGNIQCLLRANYNRVLLRQAIGLLAQIPWSTNVQEQGHASASVLHKAHRQYGNNLLVARAHLHMLRPLFCDFEREQRRSLEVKADKLRRRSSKTLMGRHIFLSDFMAANQKVYPRWTSNPEFARSVMEQHSKVWQMLGVDVQQEYELRAKAAQQQRQELLEQKKSDIEKAIEQLADQDLKKQRAFQPPPFRLSSCRWTPDQLSSLATLMDSALYSQSRVQDLRREALAAPSMPSATTQQQLAEADVTVCPKDPQPLDWMKKVATLRDRFAGRVFALVPDEEESEASYWFFLYARQSPMRLYFMSLEFVDTPLVQPDLSNLQQALRLCADQPSWTFSVSASKMVLDLDLPQVKEEEVYVLPHIALHHQGSADVCSWAQFVPFSRCVLDTDSLPKATKEPTQQESKRVKRSDDMEETLLKHPWLSAYVRGQASSTTTGSGAQSSGSRRQPREEELGDEQLDAVFAELERTRAKWRVEDRIEVQHFKCVVLGGAWTKQHVGVAVDTIKARACGKPVEQWCLLHGLPRSMSFSIRKFGEEMAGALGQCFCAVLEFFYTEAGVHEVEPSALRSSLESLAAAVTCQEKVASRPQNDPARRKLEEILSLRPTA